jgi:hypothetical protein
LRNFLENKEWKEGVWIGARTPGLKSAHCVRNNAKAGAKAQNPFGKKQSQNKREKWRNLVKIEFFDQNAPGNL